MSEKPKCSNCGHQIEFLRSVSGEVWGGFAEGDGLPNDGGRWYWEFWVYEPKTHAVRHWGLGEERIRVPEAETE